jgi:hypothetical protein
MTDALIDPPPADATSGRRVHSEAAWASAREAYLSGEAGASAAARHGIGESVFWKRAADEGWRRRDRPEPAPPPFDPNRSVLDEAGQLALIDRRLADALERGDVTESLRWQRLRERVEGQEERRLDRQERAARQADRRAHVEIGALTTAARDIERVARAGLSHLRTETLRQKVEDARAGAESTESKKTPTAAPTLLDPDAPGLSRAERRRRLKYRARHAAADP